jgi:hypothetical protein
MESTDTETQGSIKRRRAASGMAKRYYDARYRDGLRDTGSAHKHEAHDYKALNEMQQDINTIREETATTQADLNIVEGSQGDSEKQMNFLTAMFVKQAKVIDSLQSTVTDLQRRSMSNNVLLHNVPEKRDEDILYLIQQTLVAQGAALGLIDVERAHRMGPLRERGHRTIVARIARQDQVQILLAATRKDRGNYDRYAIRVMPQTPDIRRFNRAKTQELASPYRKAHPSAKIEVYDTHFTIDGKTIRDEIRPATAEEVLMRTKDDQDDMDDIKFHKTETTEERRSKFTLFAANITSSDEAKVAYKAIHKDMTASSATHLIAAYIVDDDIRGWQDDNDFGMGRFLMKTMEEKGMKNIIMFLARNFGGVHLGQRRFNIISELVREMRRIIRRACKADNARQNFQYAQDSNRWNEYPGSNRHTMYTNDEGWVTSYHTHPKVPSRHSDVVSEGSDAGSTNITMVPQDDPPSEQLSSTPRPQSRALPLDGSSSIFPSDGIYRGQRASSDSTNGQMQPKLSAITNGHVQHKPVPPPKPQKEAVDKTQSMTLPEPLKDKDDSKKQNKTKDANNKIDSDTPHTPNDTGQNRSWGVNVSDKGQVIFITSNDRSGQKTVSTTETDDRQKLINNKEEGAVGGSP